MDRRLEPRANANLPATIQQLDSNGLPMRVTIVNMSGKGLGLIMERALPAGTLVRIDIENAVLLGEVVHCGSTDAGCTAGVQIRHALPDLSELKAVTERFIASE